MKVKKIVLTTLIGALLLVIFLFSNQDGRKSESVSDAFASSVIDKYAEVKNKDYSEKEKKNMIKDTRFLVRKGAHFTVYFVLGILVYMLVCCYSVKRPILYTVIICCIFAIGDEIHQIFSPGRTARVFDVSIDTIGSSAGVGMVILVNKISQNCKRKKSVVR